jgi:hypothetical protein
MALSHLPRPNLPTTVWAWPIALERLEHTALRAPYGDDRWRSVERLTDGNDRAALVGDCCRSVGGGPLQHEPFPAVLGRIERDDPETDLLKGH